MQLLTARQAAALLRISERTLSALTNIGKIPYILLPGTPGSDPQFRYNTYDIAVWLKQGPVLVINNQEVERFSRRIEDKFSRELINLRKYDKQFLSSRRAKGYSLSIIKNKKLGLVYYVRYIENSKLVPSRWSTHTNNEEAAVHFAIKNRERLLSTYRQRKGKSKSSDSLYTIMKKYYAENSPYLKNDMLRGRIITEQTRQTYYSSILNHWVPFLRRRRIRTLDEIDTPLLARYQDYCLDKGNKPQTVNYYVSFVNNIFEYLLLRGRIRVNPCNNLIPLRVNEEAYAARGCYNLSEVQGVFNKPWKHHLSYLLCLIIYTTGMRNSEIDRIQVRDLKQISECWFIDIPKSKTYFGVRMVPLHNFVYDKLFSYMTEHKKKPEDLLFCKADGSRMSRDRYIVANINMGKITHYDKARLEKENITFYSGRHFWKTLMNAHDLGDVEEYFMGHKVTQDVAKRYNHRDKQGQEKIAISARKVFAILDSELFVFSDQ
jgi:site-specific recombinase XerD